MLSKIQLLNLIGFLDLFGVSLIVPLLGGHTRTLGGSHVFVGLLGSLYAGFQLGSGPLIGSLSDIKGKRNVLIISLLICSVAYFFIGITSSILAILCLRIVLGLFKQTQMLTKALVPEYEKDEVKQSVAYGKMAAISGVGMTLGPVIGGHIAEDYENGITINTTLTALIFCLNAGMTSMLPPTSQPLKKTKPVGQKKVATKLLTEVGSSLKQSVVQLMSIDWALYWKPFFFKLLVGFSLSIYYSNYSLILKTTYGLSPKYVGYIISFQSIITSLTSYFIEYIYLLYKRDTDYSARNFHCFIFLVSSMIGLAIAPSVYFYIPWLIPLSISNAVGRLTTMEMILKKAKGKHTGTLMGAAASVRSMSGVVAPIVGGIINDYVGINYVMWASICSALVGLCVSFQARVGRERVKLD